LARVHAGTFDPAGGGRRDRTLENVRSPEESSKLSSVPPEAPGLPGDGSVTSFAAPYEHDGASVITATRSGAWSASAATPRLRAERSGARPVGAYVVRDGRVRWRPAVDVTRLLTTAQVVVGAVVVAHRLARRPGAPKARVTMGPGGWVSMKSGAMSVRPGSRPLSRPRRVGATTAPQRAPIWARVLSAVPLGWVTAKPRRR
jgi:hypothetical protein